MRRGVRRGEHVERVEGERIFNAEAQRRRVRRGDGRVEHVERVEGIGGVRPPLALQSMKERCSRSPMIHKRAKP